MEPRELLEALVAVVATLGQLVATVAGPDGDVPLSASPRSLHTALGTFISHLWDTLGHPGVTSLDHPGVTSLGQALAALGATPGATWARVTAAASAWRSSVAALGDSWARLAEEATKLCDACRDVATTKATTAATATARARDRQDQAASLGTAGDNLVAVAWQVPLALSKDKVELALAAHKARVAAASDQLVVATKAKEEVVVATNQAGVATRRGQQAEVAQGPLKSLVAACDKGKAFPQELQRQLRDIEAALEGTKEASTNVSQALVTTVAELERLWEASARLATRHLLETLGEIRKLLSSLPGDPGGCVVAERCQKAIEAIPRLLAGQ